jgi:class 3 adenylate cyclase/tetratricopeptide (TPR) repeat protein
MSKTISGMRCLNCSHENSSDAKYCQNCGQSFYLNCPACGATNNNAAKFCKSCGTKLDIDLESSKVNRLSSLQQAAPHTLQQKIHEARLKIEGERKPVVILLTDIVDSSFLAEKLDPEDWKEIVSGAHKCVIESVYQYEGTIAQLLGDGVLAFFGAPVIHEDDPIRAVRAGLEIQRKMEDYRESVKQSAPNFHMRVGINSGLVVVGNIGSDLHIEYLALGDAVNLADRLQSLASPGKVVISNSIYQMISHVIDSDDLGLFSIKGKQQPVQVHQVNRLRDESLILREFADTYGQMVGRDAELSSLQDLIEAVKAGIGRVALITGEPGVGKSRLVSEWRSTVIANFQGELKWVESHCPSYGQGLAYSIVTELLHSLLDTQGITTKAGTRSALKKQLKKLFGPSAADIYASIGHLMALELDEKDLRPIHGMDPRALQAQYLVGIRRLLIALSAQKPLVLVCEDIHWADPSSIELLIKLLLVIHEAPIFFCFTTRQDIDAPGWQLVSAARINLGAGLTEIPLTALSANYTQQMIVSMLDVDELPAEVVRLVFGKTEGNPLFVEEVVRALLEEGGIIRTEARGIIGREIGKLEIPDNLKRLVLARVDRLDTEPKRVVRVASIIGRQFMIQVLDRVLEKSQNYDKSQLLIHLSTLEATDLIHLLVSRPDVLYLFKHALIHEAIYESVLKADRKVLHREVAQALEETYPNRVDDLAATLGYHYSNAEVHDKAVGFFVQAAESAKARYANQEAIGHYRLAIAQAEQELKNSNQEGYWTEKLAVLYESMGEVLSLIGQFEEAIKVYNQALGLLPTSNRIMRSRIYRKIGNAYVIPRQMEEALNAYHLAESCLGSLSEEADSDFIKAYIDTQLDQVFAHYYMANLPEMSASVQKVRPSIEKYGTPLVKARFYRNLVLLAYRRDRYRISEETINDARMSVTSAQESGELADLTFSTFIYGFCHLWRNELDVAQEYLKAALDLAEKIEDMELKVMSLTYLTVVSRKFNQVEKAAQLTSQSMEAATLGKMPPYIGMAKTNLTWVLWRENKFDEAEQVAREVIENYIRSPVPSALLLTWPLMDLYLSQDRKIEAFELVSLVIDLFPVDVPGLENEMHLAIQSWEARDEVLAMGYLMNAVEIARQNKLM